MILQLFCLLKITEAHTFVTKMKLVLNYFFWAKNFSFYLIYYVQVLDVYEKWVPAVCI